MFRGEQAPTVLVCMSLLALPAVVGAWLWIRKHPHQPRVLKALLVTIPLLLFIVGNPAGQVVFLLPVDLHFRERMCEVAKERKLVGKPPVDVTMLFGEPCLKRHASASPRYDYCNPDHVALSDAYDVWEYAPLPISIMSHGQHVKVFFADGVVRSVKCDL